MTTEDKPNKVSMRSLMDDVELASECDKALHGLATFSAWWIKFKAMECQGIEASFELKDGMMAKFFFRKGSCFFVRAYDLTWCFTPSTGVILELQMSLLTLRERAGAAKPNESES
jgi:hypothetical protein